MASETSNHAWSKGLDVGKSIGKVNPLQARLWPRGWVELQLFYPSMTTAPEGDEWSAARPGRTLRPGKPRYPLYRRLVGLQGRYGRAENLAPPEFDPWTLQPLVAILTELPGP
jgi:hypothetical protein